MRLDHLLSKEKVEDVVIVQLLNRVLDGVFSSLVRISLQQKTSGDDASLGHTRSHSEHDG